MILDCTLAVGLETRSNIFGINHFNISNIHLTLNTRVSPNTRLGLGSDTKLNFYVEFNSFLLTGLVRW